ncbi:SMI1/KNR4 family protein [Longibaculum muris]|uniref:SMI1/KNR4 family protein n=1 Tax=Longibaculum muris TaxID=1796628 RepID=UPI003AB5CAE0|nr:hypothetical protein [Erysipelotrichia bacterium]
MFGLKKKKQKEVKKEVKYIIDDVSSYEELLDVICDSPAELNKELFEDLKKKYNIIFPDFMEKNISKLNGAYFDALIHVDKIVSNYDFEDFSVMSFLKFENSKDLYSISEDIDNIKDAYPDLIPFMCDAGDSLYCFSKLDHKIYFIDRDEFFDEERHLLADSFEELLSKCVYEE